MSRKNMHKWAKLTIIISLTAILVPVACWGLFNLMIWLYQMGPVKGLLKKCEPQELIVAMEESFGLKFPDGITDIKAMRAPGSGGAFSFVMRFAAEPNVLDAIVKSFPGGFSFKEYDPLADWRSRYDGAPAWLKDPIGLGKVGQPNRTTSMERAHIYLSPMVIDVTDEKRYVVYWSGHY